MAAKKKSPKIRTIMMSCGYVESNMTSWLIYTPMANVYFESAQQAVTELALDMYAKFQDAVMSYRRPSVTNECCKKASLLGGGGSPEMAEKYKFCPQCGHQLQDHSFDPEEFKTFIRDLHCTDCDSYGEVEYCAARNMVFWPWRGEELLGAKKDEIVFIPENAEIVLLHALWEALPEIMTDEDKQEVEYAKESLGGSDWEQIKQKGTNFSQ